MHLLPHSLILLLMSVALGSTSRCVSQSQPNPIVDQYPNDITGTLNGTITILPIPMSLARSIIPTKYNILTHAYRSFLPNIPADMYPAILQVMHDHDVRFGDYRLDDFSRASIEFPFVDLLGDDSTPFRWSPTFLMTSTNSIGITGARDYGIDVHAATFEPACDAYAASPRPAEAGTTYYNADSKTGSVKTTFKTIEKSMQIMPSMSFFKSVVNQPSFANGTWCNHQIRMFDSPLSTGVYEPKEVSGHVQIQVPLFQQQMEWNDVVGVQVDSAFIEHHLVSCENFRGFKYRGESLSTFAPVTEMAQAFWNGLTANSSSSPVLSLGTMLSKYLIKPPTQTILVLLQKLVNVVERLSSRSKCEPGTWTKEMKNFPAEFRKLVPCWKISELRLIDGAHHPLELLRAATKVKGKEMRKFGARVSVQSQAQTLANLIQTIVQTLLVFVKDGIEVLKEVGAGISSRLEFPEAVNMVRYPLSDIKRYLAAMQHQTKQTSNGLFNLLSQFQLQEVMDVVQQTLERVSTESMELGKSWARALVNKTRF